MKKNKKERPGDSVMNISELVKFFLYINTSLVQPKRKPCFCQDCGLDYRQGDIGTPRC